MMSTSISCLTSDRLHSPDIGDSIAHRKEVFLLEGTVSHIGPGGYSFHPSAFSRYPAATRGARPTSKTGMFVRFLPPRFRIVGLCVPVQDTILFEVVCHGILHQEHFPVNRGTDIFTLQSWYSRMFACLPAAVMKLSKRTVFRIEVAEVVPYFLSYASRDRRFSVLPKASTDTPFLKLCGMLSLIHI